MERFKRRNSSLYWNQFALTAGMVLLTMLLLGVSFFALSYGTTAAEKRGEMRTRAELIAQMAATYLTAEENQRVDQQEAFGKLAEVAARMSDVDFLICTTQGGVVLTTDESLGGRSVTLPREMVEEILSAEALFDGRSDISGAYESKKLAVGVPMYDVGGELLGIVVALMDEAEMMNIWRAFMGLFFIIFATILLISFAASSLTSMRQIKPITDMVQATRAYADGNFDVRIPELNRSDEVGELARSFNAMADSLAETERQRRDFIANVSHELKTPMTTIAGYTDGILDGTIPPERQQHYLRIISDESRRLSKLVRRMLDVSRLQAKELKKEKFDICESMRLALLSMEQKIIDRGLDVEAEIPEDSVKVVGERELITQVIYNLLENATKFAAPDTPLYLGLQVMEEQVVVSVRNHGATIPPEEIPLLFERFHKSDKSRSEDKDGYGLGLYIVNTILAQHKETITVTSVDGVTTFAFTLRRSEAPHSI
ncbi:MAG: HAMP domain-containing protein [Oscillospiraceae bacterium]|nr:HAMP domain-containing protein [Oscillospiraceae bacterium]